MYNNSATLYLLTSALIILVFLMSVVAYFWGSFALMSIYKKASHPQRWSAWVPYYRDFVFFEVGGQAGWFMFLPLASGAIASLTSSEYGIRWVVTLSVSAIILTAALVLWIFAAVNINRTFGKNVLGFTIFATILPLVWLSVLAWGHSTYDPGRTSGPFTPGQGQTFLERQRQQTHPWPAP